MQGISLYPSLTEKDIERLNYFFEIESVTYMNSNSVSDISYHDEGENIILTDEKGSWGIDYFGFSVNYSIYLNNPSFLFGPNGIAAKDSEIGIAIKWFSKDSLHCGNQEVGSFNINTKDRTFSKSIHFDKGQLRGSLNLKPFLYLKKTSDIISNDSTHLINNKGYIIGEFKTVRFILDGDGSSFPFKDVEKEGAPLWWVNCAWDDPTTDKFSESVAVILNKANPLYNRVDINDKKNFDEDFLQEIVYNALEIIIRKYELSPESKDSNEDYETGSVSQAVNYWKSAFEIENVEPELIAYQLRKNLEMDDD